MIILSVQNVAKSFGINAVLRDVSLTIQQGERIGLVGVNGCGKSTLMRIIAGLDSQDSGEIALVRGMRIGYLAQQNMVTAVKASGMSFRACMNLFLPWKSVCVSWKTRWHMRTRMNSTSLISPPTMTV